MRRVYLDHNATSPLRAEAREAMIAAMDVPGNPSSVHAEGRAAKAVMERARLQVAGLVGCKPNQVVFTGSATEAAALAVAQKGRHGGLFAALPTEHDCLGVWSEAALPSPFGADGKMDASASGFMDWVVSRAGDLRDPESGAVALIAIAAANSETGVLLPHSKVAASGQVETPAGASVSYSVVCDITQMAGKVPVRFEDRAPGASGGLARPAYMILSSHKLGGPKGVGALINFTSDDPQPILRGGGQEMGRRAGTENIIGIAGFGAAAEAAARDLANGAWERVAHLRNILEKALEASAKATIFVGKGAPRLPNTSCFATPGWKGEAQVIQMDLAGFAVSAGSACSSGKVRPSGVLRAMGYDDETAASAIRVSLGLETQEEDVLRFCEAWLDKERKFRARAA